MITQFRLPDLGEGLTESEIVTWRVAEGDAVVLDQVLADVETAKATVELPSPCTGVVDKLHVAEGTVVPVGSVLVTFRVEDPSSVGSQEPAGPPEIVHAGRAVRARGGPGGSPAHRRTRCSLATAPEPRRLRRRRRGRRDAGPPAPALRTVQPRVSSGSRSGASAGPSPRPWSPAPPCRR